MNRTKSLSKSILISCVSSFLFLIHVHGIETETTPLERGLETGNADEFFSVFKASTVSSPSEEYKNVLDQFFVDKAETIKKLPFSAEQIEYMDKYINRGKTSIILLEGGLERVGEDAEKFFGIFKAVATPDPSKNYRNALSEFFVDKAETIKKLPFSAEQIEYMDKYINRGKTSIILLEGGLERVGEDAEKFFGIFKAVATPDPSKNYRNALSEFFVDKAETIKKLPFSPEQVRGITEYINKPQTWVVLLEGALQQAKGDANQFYAILDASAWGFPEKKDRNALDKFFVDNAEDIKKLAFSPEQVKEITKYINKPQTWVVLLEGALQQAKGDANQFYAILDASAWGFPEKKDRNALDKFFVDNAEDIKKLPFSTEQIRHIVRYIKEVPTSIMFLERGLERAEGDADKFFNFFKEVTDFPPSEEYKNALDKFFVNKAKTIKKLPFSTEQIRHIVRYIKEVPTSIMFLERGLERAEGDADKFFNFFKEVTDFPPSEEYKDALDKQSKNCLSPPNKSGT